MQKTYSVKKDDIKRTWHLVDASSVPLGRLSTVVATLLTGKGKPQFTKHIDCGDYVVIINAKDLIITGNRAHLKMYYHHSHYPGGLKEWTAADQLAKDPSVIIYRAVRGMLPVNKLRDDRLNRLKIYNDSEHKHEAQQPVVMEMDIRKER